MGSGEVRVGSRVRLGQGGWVRLGQACRGSGEVQSGFGGWHRGSDEVQAGDWAVGTGDQVRLGQGVYGKRLGMVRARGRAED